MIKFLILILIAIIVFPLTIFLVKKIDLKTKLMFLIGGFLIAFIGMLVQSTLSLYYALLIMVGLVFAGAVIFTKQIEKQNLADEEESFQHMPQSIKEALDNPTIPEPFKETVKTPAQKEPETRIIPNVQEDWLSPKKKEEQ